MGGYYLVNSEGTEVREPENVTYPARARDRAGAGRHDRARCRHLPRAGCLAHLPGEAELTRGVKPLAENVVALAHAPKGEDYNGPVLFEGDGRRADFRRSAGPRIWRSRGAR